MADFMFLPKVPLADDSVTSAALGVDANNKLSDKDVGKAVKLAGNNNYVVCADGDDIEGVLLSVEPVTVNQGFAFGTVQTKERFVATNAGLAAIAVGATVVAAAQPAIGTEITAVSSGVNTGTKPTPVKAGAGVLHKWRVISLLGGAGAISSTILIERL